MSKNNIQLFNKDCFDYMKSLPDNSVSLIVTDPPYGINFHGKYDPDTDWDKFADGEFAKFAENWMKEAYRVLKQDGTMWMTCAPTTIPDLFKIIEDIGFKNHLENWCCLARSKGRGAKNKLKSLRADIFHLTKSDKYTWHNTEYLREVVVPYMTDGKPRGWVLDQSTGQRVRWTGAGNVMFYSMPYYLGVGEKMIHSCQKPILMWCNLIMMSSNKGDTVLDPFSGSGSSGIAADLCDRDWIGCEKEKSMYEKSQKWINEAQNPTTRVYENLEGYVKKRLSSNEKGFKFGFPSRLILPKND